MFTSFRSTLVLIFAGLLLAACATSYDDVAASRGDTATLPDAARADTRGEQAFSVYLTGYSYWDNTPPGSAAIARPVIHRRAGGTGTYNDPITIAVGHRIDGGRQTLQYPAGTRFYIQRLRKYAIVEDVCGDGNRPQDGPCYTGYRGNPWLDIYVDGARAARGDSAACMRRLTRVQTVIRNPRPDYPVVPGALTESGCRVFPS